MMSTAVASSTRIGRHLAVLAIILSATSPPPAAPQDGARQNGARAIGIALLTESFREEAIACGRSGRACAVTPYLACPSNPRYSVRVATPFSRVAFSVYEAERTHRQPRPPSRGSANGWGVGVFVTPSADPRTADSIEKLLIRQSGDVIEPLSTTLAPVVVSGRAEGPVNLTKGFFAFPARAFAPVSDITLVLIGPSGETTCAIDRRTLASMR